MVSGYTAYYRSFYILLFRLSSPLLRDDIKSETFHISIHMHTYTHTNSELKSFFPKCWRILQISMKSIINQVFVIFYFLFL